jgi:hypothetical protein
MQCPSKPKCMLGQELNPEPMCALWTGLPHKPHFQDTQKCQALCCIPVPSCRPPSACQSSLSEAVPKGSRLERTVPLNMTGSWGMMLMARRT